MRRLAHTVSLTDNYTFSIFKPKPQLKTNMDLPAIGDHPAKANGQIQIGEAATGSLCVTIPCVLPQSGNFQTEWLGVLVKADGEVMINTVENLKEVFGWDGTDPFALTEIDTTDKEFILAQCKHEEYEGKMRFKPGFLNSASRRIQLKEVDRKTMLAKYGSKFRALSGGKPAPKTPPPATGKKTLPPPTPTGPTSKMEDVWEACCKANPGLDQEKAGEIFYAAIAEMFPGKQNTDLTPHDWGKLKPKFE